ncbi:hypothetical protein IPV08_22335 [Methylobacterium sp. SD274]|uniref:hypothetical protein n=1 Tax=Methylobacterium sp. SD274 TaxID=2782009 RepID=UPI001A964D83|nr:hypothetical protein [Methylobacterium sp. SD274]MBO1022703.1 hypothetical protein [Methylobacterium sp. SD274]
MRGADGIERQAEKPGSTPRRDHVIETIPAYHETNQTAVSVSKLKPPRERTFPQPALDQQMPFIRTHFWLRYRVELSKKIHGQIRLEAEKIILVFCSPEMTWPAACAPPFEMN